MAVAWCGYSRKGRQSRASSGGGAAGWSVSTSIPYIPWRRRSNKALKPFSGGVSGWVFCAKNWQLAVGGDCVLCHLPHTVPAVYPLRQGGCALSFLAVAACILTPAHLPQ